jgi:hypothetical protein
MQKNAKVFLREATNVTAKPLVPNRPARPT